MENSTQNLHKSAKYAIVFQPTGQFAVLPARDFFADVAKQNQVNSIFWGHFMNELLLIITLLVSFGGTILFLKVFGKGGLYAWIGIATVFANIEVTIVVHAFGMDQTLGNTLFAATFLATDILSEIYGKKDAGKGVLAGIFTSLTFILLSFMWVHYIPAESDWASEFVHGLFSNTPRMLLSSLIAYVVSEYISL